MGEEARLGVNVCVCVSDFLCCACTKVLKGLNLECVCLPSPVDAVGPVNEQINK